MVGDVGSLRVDTRSLEVVNAGGTISETIATITSLFRTAFVCSLKRSGSKKLTANGSVDAIADLELVEAILRSARLGAVVNVNGA